MMDWNSQFLYLSLLGADIMDMNGQTLLYVKEKVDAMDLINIIFSA